MNKSEEQAIRRSEDRARQMNTVAHHYDHADQVRQDASAIAKSEGLDDRDVFLLAIAALWHDIGLNDVEDRDQHPEKSVAMFGQTFPGSDEFSEPEKADLTFLIQYHDKYSQAAAATTPRLLKMLRILIDADTLELLGERGYERAVETAAARQWPKYDSADPRGETYGLSASQFDARFARKKAGKIKDAIEPTLVGQLNFQISCAAWLFTAAAKLKGQNGAQFLKDKIADIIN